MEETKTIIYEKQYGDCIVKIWKVKHLYPYRFSVLCLVDGIEHGFAGIPNYCETRHSAIMRGWYRAKWLTDNTFGKHYI